MSNIESSSGGQVSKDGIASGFAFGYDPTGRSLFFFKMDRIVSRPRRHPRSRNRKIEFVNPVAKRIKDEEDDDDIQAVFSTSSSGHLV
jgi:hypothetical protein